MAGDDAKHASSAAGMTETVLFKPRQRELEDIMADQQVAAGHGCFNSYNV